MFFIIAKSHWVCVFSDGSVCIRLADSLASKNCFIDAVVQIARIYCDSAVDSVLRLRRLSVQQQNNFKDCGLYAIAFSVEVCMNRNPEDCVCRRRNASSSH